MRNHDTSRAAMAVSRRTFLAATTVAAASVGMGGMGGMGRGWARAAAVQDAFVLPELGYAYDALEPHIDAMTMNVHYNRHHGAFIANLNRLAGQHAVLRDLTPHQLMAEECAAVPETIRTAVRNNLGGHLNHTLYWEILNPSNRAAQPTGALLAKLESDLGGWEKAKADLTAAAMGRFGSGWAWLAVKDGKLSVFSTANQDSPLMVGQTPILGIDVWEHAYYLKHQNRRGDYLAAFWEVLNWGVVGEKYAAAAG